MAGLIKILLAFEHDSIPRHLHFRIPNSLIPWSELPIRVAAEAVDWPRTGRPRLAGLSAFGFSGTNAHVIVEEPAVPAAATAPIDSGLQLLVLSATCDAALRDLAARYVGMLAASRSGLASICRAAGSGRTHFPHRLAIVAATLDEARQGLAAFLANQPSPAWRTGLAGHAAYRRDGHEVAARLARACEQHDLAAIAGLYLEGVTIEWECLSPADTPRRAALPSYPFQRRRYWIETRDQQTDGAEAFRSCLYQVVWTKQAPPVTPFAPERERRWAVVSGDGPLSARIMRQLAANGSSGTLVPAAEAAGRGATDIIYTSGIGEPLRSSAACVELLALVQSLLAGPAPRPRIWIVHPRRRRRHRVG